MITYEEAKNKALKTNPKIDTAKEYDDAYAFYNSKAAGHDEEDNVVIISKSGEIKSYISYMQKHNYQLPKVLSTKYNPQGL